MKVSALMKSAEVMVVTCLGCRRDENLVIVSDARQNRIIPEALMRVALSIGANPAVVTMLPRRYPGEEPPMPIAEAMKSARAVIVVSSVSITYSKAVEEAAKNGARILLAPAITPEIMARTIPVDYEELAKRTQKGLELLRAAVDVRLTTEAGTDLNMKFAGNRKGFMVDGLCLAPGEKDWVPAGSCHMAPLEGTAEGRLVVDVSLVPCGMLKSPVEMTIRKGMVEDIQGGREAKVYKEFLSSLQDSNVYNLGEIGIGTNPQARYGGAPIEDERVEGGVIIGIGQNILHGGKVEAKTHTDAIVLSPNLELDGKVIIEKGKLKI